MDPDATLAELRSTTDPDRMAELVAALDEWLTGGGFLPTDWSALR